MPAVPTFQVWLYELVRTPGASAVIEPPSQSDSTSVRVRLVSVSEAGARLSKVVAAVADWLPDGTWPLVAHVTFTVLISVPVGGACE